MKIEPDLRLYKEVEITDLYDLFFSETNHDINGFVNKITDLDSMYPDFINKYIYVDQNYDYTGFKLMGYKKKTKKEIEEYDQKEKIKIEKEKKRAEEKEKKLLLELGKIRKEIEQLEGKK
jgi:hypothetical protein